MTELNIAVICYCNMNRSMEAHAYLARKNLKVKSFGTSDMVRVPGVSPNHPNCYPFGTAYSTMYEDLIRKDQQYYTGSGLLGIIKRNKRIKTCPQRFQDNNEMFDVIFTCEERVYDQVLEWFNSRQSTSNIPVHIVNVEIEDNTEDAILGSFLIFDIVSIMSRCVNLEENMEALMDVIETKFRKTFLFCTMSY